MSRLLTILLAGCATLAISGAGFAEDQSTRTEPRQEQNQDDQAGQATDETDGQGQQATSDPNDQDEQAATDAGDEDTVFIIVPDDQTEEAAVDTDDQDEQAATDIEDQDIIVIVVPEDQDEQVSVETNAGGPAPQDERQTAQAQQSQPSKINSKADGAENTQDAAIPQPDYSAELKKCDWAQGKRRTHCIEATKKKFGEM